MDIDIKHIVACRPKIILTSNGLTGECLVSHISSMMPVDQHGDLMLMQATIQFSVSVEWLDRAAKVGDKFIFKTDEPLQS